MPNKTAQDEIEAIQKLRDAASEQWESLTIYLSNDPAPETFEELQIKTQILSNQIDALNVKEVQLMGAETTAHLNKIKSTSRSISDFVKKVHKVEDTISVITATVAFIGAAMTEQPLVMIAAAKALKDAIDTYKANNPQDQ